MNEEQEQMTGRSFDEIKRGGIDTTVAQLMLDTSNTIDLLEHHLRGERLVIFVGDDGSMVKEWRASGMRMMNEQGIRFFISLLQGYLQPVTYLSNLDDEDIRKMMTPVHIDIAAILCDKQEEWEIEYSYMKLILDQVTDIIWMGMKRALFARTLEALTETHRSTEMRQVAPSRKKWLPI